MSRFTVRLMAGVWVLSVLLVAGSKLAAAVLPPAPVAVSIVVERGERGRVTVTGSDLFYGGVYRRSVADGRGMFWSENACHVLAPIIEGDEQRSAMLDMRSGRIWRYPIIGYRLSTWSPAGSDMTLGYLSDGQLMLAILDAASGTYLSVPLPGNAEPVQIAWSPDSTTVLLVTGSVATGYRTHLIDRRSAAIRPLRENLAQTAADSSPVLLPPGWQWSPDSRYIASRHEAGLVVVEVATGSVYALGDIQAFQRVADFAWLSSGSQIALFGVPMTEGTAPVNIAAAGATIDDSGDFRQYPGFIWSIADHALRPTDITTRTPVLWSPDRRLLLERGNVETRVLRVETGEVVMRIVPHRDLLTLRNIWSPDGRYLALSSAHVDGKLRIVDLQTGRIVEQSASDGTLEWSPDGSSFSLYNINSNRLEITRPGDGAATTTLPMNGVTRICYPEAAP